jgi:hypothetical protein
MAIDPRDRRITHGLIPLMAVLRKKKFLEAQRRREGGSEPLAEPADDEIWPARKKKRGWFW